MRSRLALLLLLVAACSKSSDSKPAAGSAATPHTAPTGDGGVAARPPMPSHQLPQVTPPFDVKTPPDDAEKLPDGVAWKSITAGTGASPGKNDGVKIKYAAWRQDGSTFATTEPSPQPTTMWLFTAAPGFVEGVSKLKVGGKAMFWVPAELSFAGKQPHGKPEPLAYQVELVDVVPAPATPSDAAAAPADATKEKSGVAWKIIKHAAANADKPKSWDKIEMAYSGWDADGKMLDSSEIHGKPVTLTVDGLPAVFVDVVPKLAVGDRARMWFPGTMLGQSPNTPTGTVCFEVEIQGVTHLAEPPPAPPDVAKPPADALKTDKGVFYKVLTKGTGTTKPTASDQVTVNYTGWTTDGKRFDSSIPEGKPRQFRVTGVIAGWTDALMQMVVGDKWRVWIPEELAYKGAPGRPQGMLVFDVDLVSIDPVPVRPPMRPGPGGGPPVTPPPAHTP